MKQKTISIFSNSLRIPKYSNLYEFFQNGFNLTGDDRFKRFELKYSPWIKVLCEWFENPDIDWIYLIFGSQTSKTTFMMGTLLYISQYIRGAVPILWVMSTEDEVKNFIKERLKSFLNEASVKGSNWKTEAFRLFNSSFKAGYATNKTTLRTKPCRFVFGDECGIWRESIAYVKKRTRTFTGKRKGIFATTPPDNPDHHSWKEATAGNFYQWWVPCPQCGEYQSLIFSNLKWGKKDKENGWDLDKVYNGTKYQCRFCGFFLKEFNKLELINKGRAICVDPATYKQKEELSSRQRTLQISSLYSVFTSWGQLSVDFITAKKAGHEALKIFFTDELAETKREFGETIKKNNMSRFEVDRKMGFKDGFDLYTAGIDVQRKGELFYVILGWKHGSVVSGHILDYGIVGWKDSKGNPEWEALLELFKPFQDKIFRCPLDATDGMVSQDIMDFCYWIGFPFIPLKDTGCNQIRKVEFKSPESVFRGYKKSNPNNLIMTINSKMIKDDIAVAFSRESGSEGSWSFPSNTEERFYQHISNEHRIVRNGKSRWEVRYPNAPNHWFSALVYGVSAITDVRHRLQEKKQSNIKPSIRLVRKVRNKGVNLW